MGTIGWGIIGCGDVCERKSGPAFSKATDSKLVAVMRRSADKARDYAARHNVPHWYDDADALIHDPRVDAIYIATPPNSHLEYTIKAAQAKKAVYVEKPMALTYSQCREMIKVCANNRVKLFTAYYRRRLPVFLKVKELLEAATIGEIRMVEATLRHAPREGDKDRDNHHWHVIPEISGGGYLLDVGSHLLDILDFFFGPVIDVHAVSDNQAGWYQPEDICTAALKFESGVLGAVSFCFTVDHCARADTIKIVGSRGTLSFSCFDNKPVKLCTPEGVVEYPFSLPEHVQQPLIQTVVDELLGRGQCPSTGITGARTSWVMDEMVKRRGSS